MTHFSTHTFADNFNLTDGFVGTIPPLNAQAMADARSRQNRLTKPNGSLARLEDLSIQLAGMTGTEIPDIDPAVIFVYAADHGVAARGVSAYPPEVTAQMVLNYARGGAVINTLAAQIGAKLMVADVGVASDLPASLPILHRKVRPGTADWTQQPAMDKEQTLAALQVGWDTFHESGPVGLAIVGEMGIGSTTTAAVLSAALTGHSPEALAGRGTGLDDDGVLRKVVAIKAGLARHAPGSVLPTLADLGGLEIAAMTGAILAAASRRVPVVLDGFISTCAALVAVSFAPACRDYLVAGHRSPEPGHTLLLRRLALEPLLDLGLRLGEASGAALAVSLLRSSVAVLRDVATFEQAGVSNRDTA